MKFELAWALALAASTLTYHLTYLGITAKIRARPETPNRAKAYTCALYWAGGTAITLLLIFGNIAALHDSTAAKTLTAICVVLIPVTAVLTFQDDLLGQALGGACHAPAQHQVEHHHPKHRNPRRCCFKLHPSRLNR